jgi:hypothetical protein
VGNVNQKLFRPGSTKNLPLFGDNLGEKRGPLEAIPCDTMAYCGTGTPPQSAVTKMSHHASYAGCDKMRQVARRHEFDTIK